MCFIHDNKFISITEIKESILAKAVLAVLVALVLVSAQAAVRVEPGEMAQQKAWVHEHLLSASKAPPFSFILDGKNSADLLGQWRRSESRHRIDSQRTQYTITWTDPADGLRVKCVAVDYHDYPYVEWTVYFKDIGSHNTPILEDIEGLDTSLSRGSGPEFVLHGNQGDYCAAEGYQPFEITLSPEVVTNFGPPSYSGKSCDGPTGWPYYNLEVPGGGIILAIGWPGEWASSFARDGGDGLRIKAGQQLTHLYLKPGEEIRTPLIAMLFWRGTDVVRSQNIWRHWYLAHEIPRIHGQSTPPITQIQVTGNDTNDVADFLQEVCKPDLCWRDAQTGGHTWYPHDGPYKDVWLNTGTWDVDTQVYPLQFRPFSEWIHAHGMKFLLWFEPERVGSPVSWLGANHPEWLLPGTDSTAGAILNEGDPAAFNWLTNHIQNMILSQGLDWYREDMNGSGPLPAWRNHDSPDRQGITENFYVQGHLAFWDALLAMNPNLRIDSCASGGRRNDLETMRRAVPLLRSDFQFPNMPNMVAGNQCHTYGASSWMPYQSSGCYLADLYSLCTFYLPGFGIACDRTPETTAIWKQAYAECEKVAPIMLYGDYYPLTLYSLADNVWMAWQFDWPDKGKGLVQVFRRPNCAESTRVFRLNGLDPDAHYKIVNFDVDGSREVSGRDLMENGLTVEMTNSPEAAIFTYQRM